MKNASLSTSLLAKVIFLFCYPRVKHRCGHNSSEIRKPTASTHSHHYVHKNNLNVYDSVTFENIQNHFRKVRHFMFAYLEGLKQDKELDEALKKGI